MQNCTCHKTKGRSAAEVKSLLNRLARIEGQIRGLRCMVEKSAYCPDILVQSSAVSAALSAFDRALLDGHIRTCVTEDIKKGNEETVEELLALLRKMMR